MLWGGGGRVTAGWEELDKTPGFVPCPSKAVGQSSQWPGFSRSGLLDRWSGLGIILNNRWGYKLSSLSWWGSRRGPQGPAWFFVWETEPGKTLCWIPWYWGHRFCLQLGKSPDLCFLFKYPCKHGCWVDFAASVCNIDIQWLSGLKAIFGYEWGYKLLFLIGQSGKTGSKARKSLCGLDSSWPVPQVLWMTRDTGFAL